MPRVAVSAVAGHLRNGDTRPASGFEIGTSTAWRYVREAVDLLAAAADDLDTAILADTPIPMDRIADQKPYSGEASTAQREVQVITDVIDEIAQWVRSIR